jgi:hypothetical protein
VKRVRSAAEQSESCKQLSLPPSLSLSLSLSEN